MKLGEFDPLELVPWNNLNSSYVNSVKNHNISLQAARESIVLLKNSNNILPLNITKIKTIAVIGTINSHPLFIITFRTTR